MSIYEKKLNLEERVTDLELRIAFLEAQLSSKPKKAKKESEEVDEGL